MNYRMPPTACPYCAKPLDTTQAVHSDRGDIRPVGGDISLCIECGEWGIFDSNLTLRKPTDEEQLEIGHDQNCVRVRYIWNKLQEVINEGAA